MISLRKKLSLLCLIFSVIFALIGFIVFQTQTSLPLVKNAVSLRNYSFPRPNILEKQNLLEATDSEDPFSEPSLPIETPQAPVVSGLVLIGTLSGENPRAILVEKTNPKLTHIIEPGEILAGEKLVSIGKGFVILHINNQKVKLQTNS